MKKSDRVSFRTILVVTGLLFLLLVLTTVISNTIVFIGIKSGILDMRPESRLLPLAAGCFWEFRPETGPPFGCGKLTASTTANKNTKAWR